MTDDWQWFWAGEGGRDRILRDEVEGLHARLSSASSQASRLSSQLANLSGSIESRLGALSTAFDAYVELGDVREELAAYEEPAAVRREVMTAVEAIAGGRPASPVDPRGLDYWLPYAVNVVIAVSEGGEADEELDRARALAPETDLFVVAACGALGHGAAIVDLLPVVLTADEELTEHQQAIWRAVAAGAYGDQIDDLASAWRPQLDREPVSGWSAWVARRAPTPAAGISWLHTLVTDPGALADRLDETPPERWPLGFLPPHRGAAAVTESTQPTTAPVDGLRAVVTELIGRGMPAEAELLHRARELRALIENPNTAHHAAADNEPVTVVSEVRRALVSPSTPASVRAAILSWSAPALVAGVIGTIRQVTARRATQRFGKEARDRFRQDIAEATARADGAEQQRTALLVQLTGEAAALRERLASPGRGLEAQP